MSVKDKPLQSNSGCYIQDCVIGNGAYGTVYMAMNSENNTIVAMKKVKVPVQDGLPSSTMREISMLRYINRLGHPNIIKLLDVCEGKQTRSELFLYLIFEHLAQDLAIYIDKRYPFHESTIKNLSHQILCGIDFLHSNRVIHRDLKPQNILVSEEGLVKLADFGLSKTYNYEMKLTTVVVTLWYRSPEVLLKENYSSAVDVWSVGCIMAELYRGRPLFPGESEGNQIDRIVKLLGSPTREEWMSDVIDWKIFSGHQPVSLKSILFGLSDEGYDLLLKMLQFNQSKRITANQSLKHPYFSDSGYQVPSLNH